MLIYSDNGLHDVVCGCYADYCQTILLYANVERIYILLLKFDLFIQMLSFEACVAKSVYFLELRLVFRCLFMNCNYDRSK